MFGGTASNVVYVDEFLSVVTGDKKVKFQNKYFTWPSNYIIIFKIL